MSRIYNFSAGPAVLPLEVLQDAQKNLVDYKGCGMSVMEMSHRGKDYDAIHQERSPRSRNCAGSATSGPSASSRAARPSSSP